MWNQPAHCIFHHTNRLPRKVISFSKILQKPFSLQNSQHCLLCEEIIPCSIHNEHNSLNYVLISVSYVKLVAKCHHHAVAANRLSVDHQLRTNQTQVIRTQISSNKKSAYSERSQLCFIHYLNYRYTKLTYHRCKC